MDNTKCVDELQQVSLQLGQYCQIHNWAITCAESCTGGLIAKILTDIPGSSAYFEYGFVTYSNQAKCDLLQVKPTTLQKYGAVSAEVVREMAQGALIAASADIALAVSGIAGPEGGSDEKPVGTVWFAWSYKDRHVVTRCHHFRGDRQSIRLQAALFALKQVVRDIVQRVNTP